jgi:mycofactocin radical SAM maturase
MGMSAPVNLTWEVTLACNLRCAHCLSASGQPAPRELDTAEALQAVEQIHRAGVFQVNFGGGEPFLRPDFEQILDACHERGLVTCISTNGTLIDRARVKRLSRSGLVAIQVSLDGALEATNDVIRGEGTHRGATEALKFLADSPIPTSINTVLTATNALEIPALHELSKSLRVAFRVSRFRPSGRGAVRWESLRPSPAQLVAFSSWLTSTAGVRTGDSFFSLTQQERQGLGLNLCGAAKLTCCLGPTGDMYPCAFLQRKEFWAGSIRESTFQEIWDSSEIYASFRNLRIHSCESCQRFDQCHGGCPAVAYHLGRGVAGGDPECLINCVSVIESQAKGPAQARDPSQTRGSPKES